MYLAVLACTLGTDAETQLMASTADVLLAPGCRRTPNFCTDRRRLIYHNDRRLMINVVVI